MKCKCGNVGLYRVKEEVFCRGCYGDAQKAMRKLADGTKLGSKPADDRGAFYDRRRQA